MTTFGSVLALPLVGTNCALDGSTTATNGNNFSDDSSCELVTWGDWQNAGDPQLGALADNGGPTETRIPLATSPLIDAIPTASCDFGSVTTDQRGLPRSGVPACDIGAVEFQPTEVSTETELRARFADTAERSIALAADISIEDCTEVLRSSSTPIAIIGNGHSITQTCPFRVLTQEGTGTLTVADITITGGAAQGGVSYARGGGVLGLGDVIIDRATITGNQLVHSHDGTNPNLAAGGGVYAHGNLVVTDSVISANLVECDPSGSAESCHAHGGGLYGVGDLTITRSTVQGNTANAPGFDLHFPDAVGGGFYTDEGDVVVDTSSILDNTASATSDARGGGGASLEGSVTVVRSTIARNTATNPNGEEAAGGIYAGEAALVVNSTITENTAAERGGGIVAGSVTLVYATITRNSSSSGANIDQHVDTPLVLTSFASVIGLPLGGGENCEVGGASPVDHGATFVDDASCGFAVTGDLWLGTLGAHGGPTLTEVPLAGSPLIDAVGVVDCQADGATGITTDQRGFPRPAPGAGCDAGAMEVQLADRELPGSTLPADPSPLGLVPDPTFTG